VAPSSKRLASPLLLLWGMGSFDSTNLASCEIHSAQDDRFKLIMIFPPHSFGEEVAFRA
jgi:hypothetical protein